MSTTLRTKALIYGDLIAMAKKVSPHNKLRPPKLCTNKNVCADNLAQSERTELSYASYNVYIWKYREAFKMCARAGVPQYTTQGWRRSSCTWLDKASCSSPACSPSRGLT